MEADNIIGRYYLLLDCDPMKGSYPDLSDDISINHHRLQLNVECGEYATGMADYCMYQRLTLSPRFAEEMSVFLPKTERKC